MYTKNLNSTLVNNITNNFSNAKLLMLTEKEDLIFPKMLQIN